MGLNSKDSSSGRAGVTEGFHLHKSVVHCDLYVTSNMHIAITCELFCCSLIDASS
jgi:hypothetical protein